MDHYGLQRVAKIEHEQMVKSLPSVPEYGSYVIDHPGWAERLGDWLRRALGRGWAAVRTHIRRKAASLDTTLVEHIGQS